jgi:putative PIN family toxin of toxin-antitoxin system
MKLVLDTDVVVAAFRSRSGASAALLQLVDAGKVEVMLSVSLVLEYEAVLTRPEHLEAANASAEDARTTLDALVELGRQAWIDFHWRPQTTDPGDEMVLEAAINGKADAIITFNRRHFGNAPAEFGIECWLPKEALEKLR